MDIYYQVFCFRFRNLLGEFKFWSFYFNFLTIFSLTDWCWSSQRHSWGNVSFLSNIPTFIWRKIIIWLNIPSIRLIIWLWSYYNFFLDITISCWSWLHINNHLVYFIEIDIADRRLAIWSIWRFASNFQKHWIPK